jgi:hypothetical protein
MAPKKKAGSPILATLTADTCASSDHLGGIRGPGRWAVFEMLPVSLFSLKASQATSTVGRTLLTPTPYSIKMAVLDVCLQSGWLASDAESDLLVRSLANCSIAIGLPERAIVTHTIIKVRQEPKDPKKAGVPYISNVAYREFVHFSGPFQIAVDLTTCSPDMAETLGRSIPAIRYLGKRGSFVQFLRAERLEELPPTRFMQPLEKVTTIPGGVHFAWLDDFGPDATFDALNSFSKTPIKRGKHRTFTQTLVPLGLIRSGPGFSEYRADL